MYFGMYSNHTLLWLANLASLARLLVIYKRLVQSCSPAADPVSKASCAGDALLFEPEAVCRDLVRDRYHDWQGDRDRDRAGRQGRYGGHDRDRGRGQDRRDDRRDDRRHREPEPRKTKEELVSRFV